MCCYFPSCPIAIDNLYSILIYLYNHSRMKLANTIHNLS